MSEPIICEICERHCRLFEGAAGFCKARKNTGGKNTPVNYGIISGMALDPIEKKPLKNFFPGSMILSVGGFGCNLLCPFCQNHAISQIGKDQASYYEEASPEDLLNTALSLKNRGNIGIAFTYNEPLISYEYVRDTARLFKENGLKTVLVTNGSVSPDILSEVLPFVDAMNIDLKGFTDRAYDFISGSLKQTMDFIKASAEKAHVEITSLIVPGMNDSLSEMKEEAEWISGISPDIPLHITRFFPMYRMNSAAPTDTDLLFRLKDIALEHLKYVYVGNV